MRKYDLVIFDLDGTILNTLEDLADSLNVILDRYGYPQRTLSEVRGFVGNGIRLLVKHAMPEGSSETALDQLHQDFIQYYQQHCMDKTRPYEGIPELLQEVRNRGYYTAVVSNKADQAVKTLCDKYFAGLFDITVGERDGISRKPAPDSVNEILSSMQVVREKAVYIGDSDVDIATAQNAGMDGITVSWGFKDSDFLQKMGAKCLVSAPEEILDLL
ncbi:MAG: HAD family hydrolase [Lachnospiraceae bacterium]|nr:HAD family hydrolase [Lachnospiraceae bacterium]